MKPEKSFSCIGCAKYDKWLSSRTFGLHSESSQAKFDKLITIQFGIQRCIMIGYLPLHGSELRPNVLDISHLSYFVQQMRLKEIWAFFVIMWLFSQNCDHLFCWWRTMLYPPVDLFWFFHVVNTRGHFISSKKWHSKWRLQTTWINDKTTNFQFNIISDRFFLINLSKGKGTSINDVPCFLAIFDLPSPVYVAVPKQNTEYQYWKHTEVSLPVLFCK